jgi:hypothetical protein
MDVGVGRSSKGGLAGAGINLLPVLTGAEPRSERLLGVRESEHRRSCLHEARGPIPDHLGAEGTHQ